MYVIETSGLYFSYNGVSLLNDINFYARQGDYICVIGSNGTGKSTFLKLIVGLLTPDRGRVMMFGEDIRQGRDFKRFAYVSQKANLLNESFPANCLETVLTGLCGETGLFRRFKKEHKERAVRSLETVGMDGCAYKLLGELSGGQFQRVLLARALVKNPELLILDEPTAGIDTSSAENICCLLSRLSREQNITVIMVTHDLSSALSHATKLFVFDKNTAKMSLNTDEVKDDVSRRFDRRA